MRLFLSCSAAVHVHLEVLTSQAAYHGVVLLVYVYAILRLKKQMYFMFFASDVPTHSAQIFPQQMLHVYSVIQRFNVVYSTSSHVAKGKQAYLWFHLRPYDEQTRLVVIFGCP